MFNNKNLVEHRDFQNITKVKHVHWSSQEFGQFNNKIWHFQSFVKLLYVFYWLSNKHEMFISLFSLLQEHFLTSHFLLVKFCLHAGWKNTDKYVRVFILWLVVWFQRILSFHFQLLRLVVCLQTWLTCQDQHTQLSHPSSHCPLRHCLSFLHFLEA